ncbi:MAG: class I SAM-dependent methyltransferase, partial [Syntrophobacteria bacterium]
MTSRRFDPRKLEKLNDPERLRIQDPELIWKALNLKDPRVLVDIGAGTGFFAVPFCDKMQQGKVYACDISPTMVEWMKENLPRRYRDVILPIRMEESAVPLADGIADLVYMIDLHHELKEPVKIVSEAWRLLRKGGKVMIIDWKRQESPKG